MHIELWRATFPLRMRFSHNLASRSEAETLVVILTDEQGNAGYGQIIPRSYLTGETLESAAEAVKTRWWPMFRSGQSPDAIFQEADSRRENAAYAGMDVAFHSLVSKTSAAVPAAASESFPLVAVIPALSPKKAAWLARIYRWIGYRRIKLKVTRDAEEDARRVTAVRRAAGQGMWLVADANGAWDYDEAVSRMRGLRRSGIQVVEEPLRREAALCADYKKLEEVAGVSVMADESLVTLSDAERLLGQGSPSWWNLRLAKNGGVTGVAAFAALARAHGVRIYGGILVGETGALAAAGRYVFPRIGAECGEYGFSRVFLRGDPFRGSPSGYFGSYGGRGDWSRLTLDGNILAAHGASVYAEDRGK